MADTAAAEELVQEALADQGVAVQVTPLHPLEAPEIRHQHLRHKETMVALALVLLQQHNTLGGAVGPVLPVGMQT